MTLILIILLILLFLGGGWGYRTGYVTSWNDPLSLVLLVLLVIIIIGAFGYSGRIW